MMDTPMLELCPVCAQALAPGDVCATDIELGTCHAACLEGTLIVDLDTGEAVEGPIDTYLYDDCFNPYGSGPVPIEPREG